LAVDVTASVEVAYPICHCEPRHVFRKTGLIRHNVAAASNEANRPSAWPRFCSRHTASHSDRSGSRRRGRRSRRVRKTCRIQRP